MISSILEREFLTTESILNIAWTPCDNIVFELFIKDTCKPCNLISLTETYYGMNDIAIIFCNNRLTHLDKSIELARFFSCPLMVIDHNTKPEMVSNNIDSTMFIDPVYQIATSKEIHLSWNKIHNSILEYNINNQQSKNIWKNLIFQLSKSNMVVKDEQIITKNK